MTELIIKLFIKNSESTKDNAVRKAYGTLGGFVGIICNLILCVIKITVGLISGSISIMADGFNNLSDMGSSLITIIGFKLAGKPADKDHPFGHGRIEYISAFIVAMLILIVGVDLFESSVSALINNNTAPTYSLWAIIVLAVSVLIKFWMFLFNKKLSNKISSEVLLATAKDSLNDAIATAVILLSVAVTKFVTLPFNLDALMGILVALFILWAGIGSARDTLNEILGKPPEKELIEELENIIMSFKEFVGIHDLIVHNYGVGRQFASVHVEVPQDIDIVKCHEQVDLCEKLVGEQLNLTLVIHMDPIDIDNEIVNETKQKLTDTIKVINENLTLHDFRMTPLSDKRTNLIFDVVVPAELKMSEAELEEKIITLAKLINPIFECVITFDNDFCGH
ncbi:MAG: cation transporter [Clostridia bacterium]|nr:cation transporter [Clostridia bacterium]